MANLSDSLNAVTIRHESGLSNQLVGVADTREFDAVINTRKAARAVMVQTEFQNSATPYAWPLSLANLRTLLPNFTDEERQEMASTQWSLAIDATRAFVLGDLYLRASQRDPEYRLKAEVFFEQGKTLVKTGKDTIRTVITGQNSDAETGEGVGEIHSLVIKLPNWYGYDKNEFGCC